VTQEIECFHFGSHWSCVINRSFASTNDVTSRTRVILAIDSFHKFWTLDPDLTNFPSSFSKIKKGSYIIQLDRPLYVIKEKLSFYPNSTFSHTYHFFYIFGVSVHIPTYIHGKTCRNCVLLIGEEKHWYFNIFIAGDKNITHSTGSLWSNTIYVLGHNFVTQCPILVKF